MPEVQRSTTKKRRTLLPEQERALSIRVRELVKFDQLRTELNESLGRMPTDAEWARAAGFSRKDEFAMKVLQCRRAKGTFVSANLPLVYAVAKRYRWVTSMTFEDVVQEGIFGLSTAVERFDPDLGYRFSTYAVWWIRQAISSALMDQSQVIRLPQRLQQQLAQLDKARCAFEQEHGRDPNDAELADVLRIKQQRVAFLRQCGRTTASPIVSFDAASSGAPVKSGSKPDAAARTESFLSDIVADERCCPVKEAESNEFRSHVKKLLRTALNPRECRVLELRFGLDDGDPKSLKDIAKIVERTPDQIRIIKAKALNKLRQPNFPGVHLLRDAYIHFDRGSQVDWRYNVATVGQYF